MKTTYTVKQFEQNSWNVDSDGNFAGLICIWDCGHKHRTLRAAIKCLNTLHGYTRSIGAEVVANDDSIIDPVEYDMIAWDIE